ncbi:hypothetical protein VTN00DRAFT_5703 [Thermoascus crustaceus]|uniref:uncharacterized protein n=1 Tax=Thermoascus crustaceus TaxID=5088 RepID=UPI003743B972
MGRGEDSQGHQMRLAKTPVVLSVLAPADCDVRQHGSASGDLSTLHPLKIKRCPVSAVPVDARPPLTPCNDPLALR